MTTDGASLEQLLEALVRNRVGQLIINDQYTAGDFKIPIHLALGHEAIATATATSMDERDQLLVSHRNIHYHLARSSSLKPEIDEYLLKPTGLGEGRLGSMNLASEAHNIPFASSILGNNLPVATGLAMAQRRQKTGAVTFVVTGDGAMEEGVFYESLTLMRSLDLACVVIVENNEWSLATRIYERRSPIDIEKLAASLDIGYIALRGNDVVSYNTIMTRTRQRAAEAGRPIIVECFLRTLGYRWAPDEGSPGGKRLINYHAGPANIPDPALFPLLEQTADDPLFVAVALAGGEKIDSLANALRTTFNEEIS